jgi:hypothetical protein
MAATTPPKLKKRYGKLTVVGRFAKKGRGMAHCVCKCGKKVDVRTNNLIKENTKSCGAPLCRDVVRVAKDKDYKPYGSRAMTRAQIKRMWTLYTNPKKRLSVLKIADKIEVNRNTAYSTMRAIRRVGGLDAYLKKVA